jgi:hypothetical protein
MPISAQPSKDTPANAVASTTNFPELKKLRRILYCVFAIDIKASAKPVKNRALSL